MRTIFSLLIFLNNFLNFTDITYAMPPEDSSSVPDYSQLRIKQAASTKKYHFSSLEYDESADLFSFTIKKKPTIQQRAISSLDVIEATYDESISYTPRELAFPKIEYGTLAVPPQLPQKKYKKEPLVYKTSTRNSDEAWNIPPVTSAGADSAVVETLVKEGCVETTEKWPYSMCAFLKIVHKKDVLFGSGGMVGPQHVLTAAHILCPENRWAKKISVYPALNENKAPFGKAKVIKIYVFKQNGTGIALLILNKPIGKYTGWYGFSRSIQGEKSEKFAEMPTTGYLENSRLPQMFTQCLSRSHDLLPGALAWVEKSGLPMLRAVGYEASISSSSTVDRSFYGIGDNTNINFITNLISETYVINKLSSSEEQPIIPTMPSFSFEEWRQGLVHSNISWAIALYSRWSTQNLPMLDFGEKQIGNTGCIIFASALKMNPFLTSLKLDKNKITSFGIKVLWESLLTNSFLQHLDLSSNKIENEGALCISNLLIENASLTSLNLEKCNIAGVGGVAIGNALRKNSSLKILNMKDNGIGVTGIQSFCLALQENSSLINLNLSHITIGKKGAEAISDMILLNSSLTCLELERNHIEDEEGIKLYKALTQNSSLTYLNLENNKMHEKGKKYFKEAMEKRESLNVKL